MPMDTEIEYSTATNIEPKSNKSKKSAKDINKLPKNAFALFVKLYCGRKYSKSLQHTSKMIEATKSWITLSDYEKQKFYYKYKEYQQKYSDIFISCLQKSEPFMKKRCSLRSQTKTVIIDEQAILDDDKNELTAPYSASHENLETDNVVIDQVTEMFDNDDDIQGEQIENTRVEEDNNTLTDPSRIPYLEPIPPSLKSGKELFEIIQSNAENDLQWATLPQREKSLYNQAILTMKKDYIQKYKIYLETLTQKELFDHYNKCFKS